jgi:ATP-independent RNA helicase DbpA
VSVEQEVEAAPDIQERVVEVAEAGKLATLGRVLAEHAPETALVFANQKVRVARIEEGLAAAGLSVATLHGDLEQRDRDRVMAKFRNGSTRVLVATDVAARGIDLAKLELVVNFDLPSQPEVYVHRIGRTGRAGQSGLAVSLCAPNEASKRAAIEAYTGRALEIVRYDAGSAKPASTAAAGLGRAKMVTLRLSGGRKDKLRPGDILGALTGEGGGLAGDQIGKIEIHDRFSIVALAASVGDHALASLRAGRLKGKRFRVERVE